MINKALFFKEYRVMLDKTLTHQEVKAIDVFINLVDKNWAFFDLNQWAYIFATVYHETRYTFEPVIEAFWMSEGWRKKNLWYYPWYGRGYPQTTHEVNYKRASKIAGVDFIKNPELMLVPEYAFITMINMSRDGLYTGKKLLPYSVWKISKKKNSIYDYYKEMRKVINGTDKDTLIATQAVEFERILKIAIK